MSIDWITSILTPKGTLMLGLYRRCEGWPPNQSSFIEGSTYASSA